MRSVLFSVFILSLSLLSCAEGDSPNNVITGAERMDQYIKLLKGKKVGVVANHTSLVGSRHLVDTLMDLDLDIVRIFSPEHGFRGQADAGAHIEDGIDISSGLPVISLYGSNRKPGLDQFEGLDIIIFDIQDVGARFYTYISTMEYVMGTAALSKIQLIILDRPNPNGHYVDGPVLDTAFRSFVGMQPIPVVHGMTVAEYALMLNSEGWLNVGARCDLKVVPCLNYNHNTYYSIKVPPSPNLPNQNSVYLYPSICFFEGTVFSCGRGTETPFQVFGHPDYKTGDYSFTPLPSKGAANPKLNGKLCYGHKLTDALDEGIVPENEINLTWLIEAYKNFPEKDEFFNSYFNTLAGNDILKQQIVDGLSEKEIRLSWKEDLDAFRKLRSKYLLYD